MSSVTRSQQPSASPQNNQPPNTNETTQLEKDIRQSKATYADLDRDGDGQLSRAELGKAGTHNAQEAEQQSRQMIDKYDTDGDGQLSEEESRPFAKPKPPPAAGVGGDGDEPPGPC